MKKYFKYYSTNLQWIEKIPFHWEIKRLKYIAQIQGGYAFKSDEFGDNGMDIIRIGDIASEINLENCKKSTESNIPIEFKTRKSDTLIALSGATVGKMCFLENDLDAYINQRVARVTNGTKWLHYVLNSEYIISQIKLAAGGSAQENISNADIGKFFIPMPPQSEQTAITNYLDQKTTQIDKLISNKQKLIELLKEERTAVINEAVSRGLKARETLIPSGIDYIGLIPHTWTLRRLSTLGEFFKGRGIKKDETIEAGLPCIRYGEIYTKYDRIVQDTFSFINIESSLNSVLIKRGSMLFAGSGETVEDIGKAVVYLGETQCFAGGDIIVFNFQEDLDPIYASFLINAPIVQYQKTLAGKGEIIVHIYPKNIREIVIPLPPLKEQLKISKYLEEQTNSITISISKIEKEISLLHEYRTALISEVVTGKMDVRNYKEQINEPLQIAAEP